MSVLRRAHDAPEFPTGTATPDRREPTDPAARPEAVPDVKRPLRRTRAGSAYVAACVCALLLAALIVFVAQNTSTVAISFLMLHGQFPLAVALLAAAVGGAALSLIVAATRILQLRHITRRQHRGLTRPGNDRPLS
jgi:putative membrane protein